MKILAAVVVIAALIAFGIAWEVWRWGECRQVGHGVMYCLFYR